MTNKRLMKFGKKYLFTIYHIGRGKNFFKAWRKKLYNYRSFNVYLFVFVLSVEYLKD